MSESPDLFVGVDWATEAHQVCVIDCAGKLLGERSVPHTGEGLSELCSWLHDLAEGSLDRCAVSIEIPHGAVVETLMERGFVVHAINPKQLDRFRDRFTVAGAKDDRRDAYVLADSLRTDMHCFRRLVPDDPTIIELRGWSRSLDELQHERNRLSNRLRAELRRYYPQALGLTSDVGANWFLDVLEKVPTPAAAKRVREKSIAAILARNRIRRIDASQVLEVLRELSVTVAPGTEAAATAHINLLSDRMRLVNKQVKDCRRELERLCQSLSEYSQDQGGGQRDVEIIRSFPGIGTIILATLLAEASQPLRQRDYHALRCLGGVAPITKRSGKKIVVIMRQACNERVRNALYHWARVGSQNEPWIKDRYAALRQRGCSHGRALRGIADRLLNVLCAMLRNQDAYSADKRSRPKPESAA